mmetsp:Transcript_11690/g.30251  ORF Transcript_11690/g.30251 Transcript_11690/m.30251 type:complete len:287 (-) Transcript_11690:814-1674(-)
MARSRSRVRSFSVSNCCTRACEADLSCLDWATSSSVLESCSARTPRRSRRASASDSSALRAASTLLLSCSRRITLVSSFLRLSSLSSLCALIPALNWLISLSSCSSLALYRVLSALRPSCSVRSSASHLARSCSSLALSSSMYVCLAVPCSSICCISSSIFLFFCSVSVRACSMVARASSASLSMWSSLSLSCEMVLRWCSALSVRISMASLLRFSASVAPCSSRRRRSKLRLSSSSASSCCSCSSRYFLSCSMRSSICCTNCFSLASDDCLLVCSSRYRASCSFF